MLQEHAGVCADTLTPVQQVVYINFVSTICCTKFNWLNFIWHVMGTRMPCMSPYVQGWPTCPCKNKYLSQLEMMTRMQWVHALWKMMAAIKGRIAPTPCNNICGKEKLTLTWWNLDLILRDSTNYQGSSLQCGRILVSECILIKWAPSWIQTRKRLGERRKGDLGSRSKVETASPPTFLEPKWQQIYSIAS